MKSLLAILFTLLLLQPAFLSCTALGAEKKLTGRVVKVIDGDSIKIRSAKKSIEVRLYGIDAPEYDQPYAAKAKKYVKKVVLDKRVTFYPVEEDRYGRLVAIVEVGDSTINERLLKRGLAWYYPKYCKKSICSSWKKQSRLARKKKKNIWSDKDPVAPWKWKYKKHKEK